MSDHLGYAPGQAKPQGAANHRNGKSAKTVLTDTGSLAIKVPRDRAGSFEPQLIGKHEWRFTGFDDKIGKHESRWSTHYAIREKRNLEKDLFPHFAARRIGEIEPIELLAALRRVEERGALDVAHRVLITARAVWRYAVATARAPRD